MSSEGTPTTTILGLDLGTASVGWCLIEADPTFKRIIASGVRIFPEGMDRTRGEKSLNQDRRDARALRRQGYRRVRRKQKLLNALRDAGLLPKGDTGLGTLCNTHDPYRLRARALDEKLEPFELGRALYHLGQRRGYLSNRKTGDEKEGGKVADGIGEIAEGMKETKARTLGEYFHIQHESGKKVRGRYTARKMFLDEFEKIWDAQARHHPQVLNVANRKRIFDAIFCQRPLKKQKGLVGECEFEPGRKRAAAATLVAQEFRLWQTLNNLKVLFADGEERWLTDKERLTLHKKLCETKQLSWEKIKQALAFFEGDRFNLERMRKSGLLGNQTAAIVSGAAGKKSWKALGERGREQLVYDLLNIDSDEALKSRLRRHWKFDEDQVAALLKKSLALPKGYLHLSQKAARNILRHLNSVSTPNDRGPTYDQACRAADYDHTKPRAEGKLERLPYPGALTKEKPRRDKRPNHADAERNNAVSASDLRNPLVTRALYQMRRVVNAIINQYRLPTVIRVEMARDLKSSAKQRDDIQKRQRQNEVANEKARQALIEFGIPNPSRTDTIKYRLWEECGHTCPYTGKAISMNALFGDHPDFDIEHIIPYTRCLDDGYMNKTLCHNAENAAKGNLTPWEFYHGNDARYEQVLQRAKKLPYPKFKRFSQVEVAELQEFVSQQLNETRYIARKAIEYLGQLGCTVEPVKGGTTAILRRAWGLNNILGDSGEKTRIDHRHHAVDALVVALTDRAAVQKINRYSALSNGRIKIEGYPEPLPDLRQQARDAIGKIVVSHKPQRKVKGPLHNESLYGLTGETDASGTPIVVIRHPVSDLQKAKDLDHIRDPNLRELARAHLEKSGGDFKHAFNNPDNPFGMTTRDGGFRPIRKLRMQYARSVAPIGKPLNKKNGKRRNVWTRSNHHMEIVERPGKKGKPKWDGVVVSTLEAATRLRLGKPAIQKDHGEEIRFVMALHQNDMIELEHEGEKIICRVEKMDQNGVISLRLHTDTDKQDWRRAIRKKPRTLQQANAIKINIDPLGATLTSHD